MTDTGACGAFSPGKVASALLKKRATDSGKRPVFAGKRAFSERARWTGAVNLALKVQREPVAVTSPAKVLVHAQGFALFKVPPPVALRPAAEGVARRNSRLSGGGGCRASRSRGR